MKVHLIKEQTIWDYVKKHARSGNSFDYWLLLISRVDWFIPEDIKQSYTSADLIGNGSNRVVFNIGGNDYRMICKYFFGKSKVHLYICWMGTHAEYTKLCKNNEQYTIHKY